MNTYRAQPKSAEREAQKALERVGIEDPPVPVGQIARQMGIRVKPSEFGDDVSGLLVLSDGSPKIGYNERHANVRQRFTIAHELGHFLLHQGEDQLFIDKQYGAPVTFYRDGRSSEGKYKRERDANTFAAALLMPRHLLEREIDARGFDLANGDALSELAGLFQVSRQAMAFRLANSGIFAPATDHIS